MMSSFLLVSTYWQVLITDKNLELVDDGIQYIIHVDKDSLDKSVKISF